MVGLANSLVWQFAGPDDYTSHTLLDFSLVQPLLRAGGRARVMERLTIAERALLANVRQMEQYRRAFYLAVVTGSNSIAGADLNRRGGFFGGSGLEGFTGVGGGGFGQVGGFGGRGLGQNFGFTGGAGAEQAGGYVGLLQSAQIIRNQYATLPRWRDSVEQLAGGPRRRSHRPFPGRSGSPGAIQRTKPTAQFRGACTKRPSTTSKCSTACRRI